MFKLNIRRLANHGTFEYPKLRCITSCR